MNIHDYGLIPSHMKENLDFYVSDGWALGGFLHAIVSNDLQRAVGCADDVNMRLIPTYASYVYNKMPFGCHGSPKAIELWIKKIRSLKNDI